MDQLQATYPDLQGKVAFVTGGSRGIGAETARLLAANGVRVAVSGRDLAAIDAVVDAIREDGGEAISAPADCTDVEAIARAQVKTTQAFGQADILIAFAGGGAPGRTLDICPERWQTTLENNLTATFLTTRAFLPSMQARGSGCIVTMASSAGRLPSQAAASYDAAKAGVIMYTRHIANEFGPSGIRVNCIAPAAILTERNAEVMPAETQRQVAAMHPLGRIGTPRDVANAALFLSSEASSWITGVTLDVAGGRVML